jgi:DNA repair exonuclease SbcCD ATPase subunit
LRALARILIGEDGTKIKIADAINNVWKKGAWGFVQFDVEGEQYRIIETRKWAKSATYPVSKEILGNSHLEALGETYSGTGLYLEKWDGQMWRDMRVGKRMEHTRALILDKIGMDYDGFCSTSYLAQRRGLRIIEARPKERFDLISPLADLTFWNKVKNLVNQELSKLNDAAIQARAIFQEIENQITAIDQIPDSTFAEWQRLADNHEASIDEHKKELEVLRDKLSNIAGSYSSKEVQLREQLAKLLAERDNVVYVEPQKISSLKESINNHNRAILNVRNHEVDQLTQVEGSIPDADISAASMDVEELQAKINHTNKLLKDSNTEVGICWYCGSEVTKDHIDKHIQQLNSEVAEYSTELKTVQDRFDNLLQQRHNRVKEAKDKIKSENKTKIDEFTRLIEAVEIEIKKLELEATQASLAIKEQKNVEIEEVKQQLSEFPVPEDRTKEAEDLKNNIKTLEAVISNIEVSKANCLAQIKTGRQHNEDQAKKLSSLMGRMGEIQTELTSTDKNKELYSSLEKEFGRTGIQAFEISTLLDEFNHYLSSFIWVLTDGMLKVELSPYKEKKTDKNGVENIVEIKDRRLLWLCCLHSEIWL